MARILFITQTAHPLGGVEVWLDDLAPALATHHEVTLGLVRGRRFHDPRRYLSVRPVRVPTVAIDGRTGTTEGRIRAVDKAITDAGAEIVVPVNIVDVLEAARRQKARGRNVRLLYPLHGIGADYLLDVLQFHGVIDLAVTMSRLGERALRDVAMLDPDRVVYTTYGVPAPRHPPTFDVVAPPRFVYVGRLEQDQKRVLDLIPLCRALDARQVPFRLDVAGGGSEEGVLRSALGSHPHVRFLGALSREELFDRVYPGAAALVLLSEWETGPIVAWEAMRHGATILTTQYLGLKAENRLRDGENAVVVPIGDVEALAAAMEWLVREPALLMRLRRAAHESAERELRIEQSMAGWQAAFDTCLRVPPAVETHVVSLPSSRGRLDRIAGPYAESIRHVLRLGMMHNDSGAEWPHSYHTGDPRSAQTDATVLTLDR